MNIDQLMKVIGNEALANLDTARYTTGNKEKYNYFRGVYEGLLKANQLIKEVDEEEKRQKLEQKSQLERLKEIFDNFVFDFKDYPIHLDGDKK